MVIEVVVVIPRLIAGNNLQEGNNNDTPIITGAKVLHIYPFGLFCNFEIPEVHNGGYCRTERAYLNNLLPIYML